MHLKSRFYNNPKLVTVQTARRLAKEYEDTGNLLKLVSAVSGRGSHFGRFNRSSRVYFEKALLNELYSRGLAGSGSFKDSLTCTDYIYCMDCSAYVDLWAHDSLKDTGHDGCNWRFVTPGELEQCIRKSEASGCFEEEAEK